MRPPVHVGLLQSLARPPALHAAAASSRERLGRSAWPRRAAFSGTEERAAAATRAILGMGGPAQLVQG